MCAGEDAQGESLRIQSAALSQNVGRSDYGRPPALRRPESSERLLHSFFAS
jgi:hypothetical protein